MELYRETNLITLNGQTPGVDKGKYTFELVHLGIAQLAIMLHLISACLQCRCACALLCTMFIQLTTQCSCLCIVMNSTVLMYVHNLHLQSPECGMTVSISGVSGS